jgi:D-glycero-D-manno-heptose 1,7-bisphosphate phosphatase
MPNAVFMDRDGVLIEDGHLLTDASRMSLMPNVPDALKILARQGFRLVVVTNQTVVARGMATESDIMIIHENLSERIYAASRIRIDAFMYCPHHPHAQIPRYRIVCDCRKPKPGMLFEAARAFNLQLAGSYMIGDRLSDIAAGNAAGCKSIWVQTGHHHDPPIVSDLADPDATPAFVCNDLLAAAQWIENYQGAKK